MPIESANEYSVWLNNTPNNVLRSLRFQDSSQNDEWEPTKKLISSYKEGRINFQNVIIENENHNKFGAFLSSFLQPEFTKVKNEPKTAITAKLGYKLAFDGSTLIFCATPKNIVNILNKYLTIIKDKMYPNIYRYNNKKESSYYAHIWYGDSIISEAIDHGIGAHYGDMPEQVRVAVENDFRSGKLVVLLSTNTIGQGINFPIKNIVIYSLCIGRNEKENRNINIQKRDFWNIVGRAGRAGQETEGKIIFIVKSPTDAKLYKEFTDKAKIEPADSLFYRALCILKSSNHSEEEFDKIISELSEIYLMDLMDSEDINTDYNELLNKVIANSLVNVQAAKANISTEPLKQSFYKALHVIEKDCPIETIDEYKKTGFSLNLCYII
jgi:replicative superfamily II helicase